MNNIDPKLGPLADNGGSTLTMALLRGSPAIDSGNTAAAPQTDQRGFSRPFGAATDIGAYEIVPLLRADRALDGGIDLLAFGINASSCSFLASSNLSDWLPIARNKVGPDATTLFHDYLTNGLTCRFYRVVSP
jgi:hypothetical protein